MRYPNVASLYFDTALVFNAPDEGIPRADDLRKISPGGQWVAKVQNGKNIAESFNPVSRAHERYRRQTDDRRICDSKDPNVT